MIFFPSLNETRINLIVLLFGKVQGYENLYVLTMECSKLVHDVWGTFEWPVPFKWNSFRPARNSGRLDTHENVWGKWEDVGMSA
jgi:hypothetical protein